MYLMDKPLYIEYKKDYSNKIEKCSDLQVREYYIEYLLGRKIHCPFGGCEFKKVYRFSDGKRFKCPRCKKIFTLKTNTIFSNFNLSLKKCLLALNIFAKIIKISNRKEYYYLNKEGYYLLEFEGDCTTFFTTLLMNKVDVTRKTAQRIWYSFYRSMNIFIDENKYISLDDIASKLIEFDEFDFLRKYIYFK